MNNGIHLSKKIGTFYFNILRKIKNKIIQWQNKPGNKIDLRIEDKKKGKV